MDEGETRVCNHRGTAFSRRVVTVAPITTRIRNIPVEVRLGPEDGLPKACGINLDSIVTIAKSHLKARLIAVSDEKIVEAEQALRFALALED